MEIGDSGAFNSKVSDLFIFKILEDAVSYTKSYGPVVQTAPLLIVPLVGS